MQNSRDSIVLAADLPDHARIESRDKERADELASRFHQVFGECVYAYGGTVNDTIGSIVIAELPDATSAVHSLENLRKRAGSEFAGEAAMTPRAVLTSGEVHEKDFSLAGRAVQNALAILDSLKKGQMLVAADLVKGSGHVVEGDPVLTLGATAYHGLPLARPAPVRREPASATAAAAGARSEDSDGADDAAPELAKKSSKGLLTVVAIATIVILAGIAYFLLRSPKPEPVPTTAAAPAPSPEPVDETIQISVGDVSIAENIGADDGSLATDVAEIITAILRSADDVELNALAPNKVGADVRLVAVPPDSGENVDQTPAAASPQPVPAGVETIEQEPLVVPWIERSGERFEGPGVPYDDNPWTIVVPAVQWASEQLGFEVEELVPESAELRQAFAAAVVRKGGGNADPLLAKLHQALLEEPDFLAGWLLLSQAETNDPSLEPVVFDALRNISRIMPDRADLARDLGRRELLEGTLVGAIDAYSRVRNAEPADGEARLVFGLAALASHQAELFGRVASEGNPRLHPADVEISEGKVDEGVKKYYEAETADPNNPYLSFKIGRIAVLRRSPQIAKIEIDKLEASGMEPQRSLLRAYVAADEGDRRAAEAALDEALRSSEWADSAWFHAAEVYAILRDAGRTVEAIEKSVERREPMMHAIATNPLFRYLSGDPRFREAVRQILILQRSIGQRLQGIQ